MLSSLLLSLAFAQTVEVPDFNAQNFRPTVDGRHTLWMDDARRGTNKEAFWRFVGHYTNSPLVYEFADETVIDVVGDVAQANLAAGYNYEQFRIALDLPVYLLATSDLGNDSGGLGDLSVDARYIFIDGDDAPVNLGIKGRLTLPTGSHPLPLTDPTTGYEVALLADRNFDQLVTLANVGFRGRAQTDLGTNTIDDALIWRAGLAYEFTEKTSASAELASELLLGAGEIGAPIEGLLGVHSYVDDALVVRGGIGKGFTGGIGSPDLRLMAGIGWEPRTKPDLDLDGDGILDSMDQCIDVPEDMDGFEDEDGCPELDNDQDGVLDAADRCIDVPEDRDGYEDTDGCPETITEVKLSINDPDGSPVDLARIALSGPNDYLQKKIGPNWNLKLEPGTYEATIEAGAYVDSVVAIEVVDGPPMDQIIVLEKDVAAKIIVTKDRIELAEEVYFATGKADIKPESFEMLDQVVAVLGDYPEIKKLQIDGHTDSRGSDSLNLKLSKARAKSVLEYFVEKGVDADRLASEGYGESKPIDEAKTEEAYAKNRRVEIGVSVWEDMPRVIERRAPEEGEEERSNERRAPE